MSLPIRGVLFTLSEQPSFVIAVQILDGVGAALFGVLSVLVVADLTKGTGHFDLAQGAIATATGIGASLSLFLAGLIVEWAGYRTALLSLAAVAMVALLIFWTLMPETKEFATGRARPEGKVTTRCNRSRPTTKYPMSRLNLRNDTEG